MFRHFALPTVALMLVSLLTGTAASAPAHAAPAPARVAASATTGASGQITRVATFNIRCQCSETNPQNVWDTGNRRSRAAAQIKQSGAQIVGLQETYARQVTDLFGTAGGTGLLGAGWAHATAAVPEAMNAIGWNTAGYSRVASGYRQLTTGPAALDGSSRAYERTVTWVKLRSLATGHTFYVFNTHLEHRGTTAVSVTGQTYGQIRTLQTQESLAAITAINTEKLPVILTGDFNADQRQAPFSLIQNSGIVRDSLALASQKIDANLATFNGWQTAKLGNRVDFTFVSPGITVHRYEVYDTYISGLFASDHFPVLVDVELPAPSAPLGGGTTRVYSVPISSTLYGVTGSGSETRAAPLSFSQWAALGYPRPLPAPATFVKYPWCDNLFMVNFWNADPKTWTWTPLGLPEWSRAGYPRPAIAGWIEGTTLVKYGTGDQLFATLGSTTKALTLPEWQAMGFKPFVNRSSSGFVKAATSSTIYYVPNLATMKGTPLSFAQWAAYGFPPPRTVARVN
ncbi:endonuclease/exonuclease/phosphatase family protein [Micrococcales bacterium 31B]|nr:endonuclease/exonuclease/phosphatase family protein [Micrococcales bacterium 31B]